MMDCPVDMAHSELRSLVTKAARGAGLPWGMAEEAGRAAEWLARRSMPAGEWAADWMAAALEGRADPVSFGTALADSLAHATGILPELAVPDDLVAPGYVLPFLHSIAQHRGSVQITGRSGLVARVDADGRVQFGPSWRERPDNWRIGPTSLPLDPSRARLSASLLDCLEGLALRTTVPPSDRSRADAGSVKSDND